MWGMRAGEENCALGLDILEVQPGDPRKPPSPVPLGDINLVGFTCVGMPPVHGPLVFGIHSSAF